MTGRGLGKGIVERISKDTFRLGVARKTRVIGTAGDGKPIREESTTYLEIVTENDGKVKNGGLKSNSTRLPR